LSFTRHKSQIWFTLKGKDYSESWVCWEPSWSLSAVIATNAKQGSLEMSWNHWKDSRVSFTEPLGICRSLVVKLLIKEKTCSFVIEISLSLFFFFGDTAVWTWDLTLARQALYHWSHFDSLKSDFVFSIQVLAYVTNWIKIARESRAHVMGRDFVQTYLSWVPCNGFQ
jgi:hypothetical protein